ncbi:MAG: cytochrome c oxidase subunit II [Cyclobacteriaceae bacterium]
MIQISLLLGVVLILAIVLLIYRLHTLVSVIKGSDKKQVTGSNKVNAILMMAFLILGLGFTTWYSIAAFDDYNPPVASEHGLITDRLFWVTMLITGIVFIITQVLLFYFSYKYQHKPKAKALFYADNNKLEIIWTLVPAVVLTFLVLYGLKVWNDITKPAPENAEIVEIMGYQFAWKVRYPGKDKQLGDYDYRLIDAENAFGTDFRDKSAFDDFSPRQMVLPKGRPVELKIRARDVLHSVFAPHFRLKMDAVPGMPTRFWFVPTKTTAEMRAELGNDDFNYEIACTEICGRGHFSMRMLVEVLEPEEYDRWFAEQEPWLAKNPEYLSKVPDDLKELALVKGQVKEIQD